MKLSIIRQLYQTSSPEKLSATLDVLESVTEARGIKEDELNVIGELITNICGAIEVHQLVNEGLRESEALNVFARKVLDSIDKVS
ncbi:MAG: hypothetical protein LC122_08520 [Chitinophagales bacterium]|nr:hypothetical protein [Chitinophagales bacterium]